jgi:hypothetical protein
LVREVLARAGIDASVYDIDMIEIPTQLCVDLGVENNNRGRVLALAQSLDTMSAFDLENRVICIVDSDLDFVVPPRGLLPKLALQTDYTSLPLYALNPSAMSRLFRLVFRANVDGEAVVRAIAEPLRGVFACRVVSRELGLEWSLIPFERFCALRSGEIRFDLDTYLERMLTKNGLTRRRQEVVAAVRARLADLPGEIRRCCNSHDFVKALHWYASKQRGSRLDEWLFERSLWLCIDQVNVLSEPMFVEMTRRLRDNG